MTRDLRPGESFAELFESENLAPRRRALKLGDEIDVSVVQVGQNAVFVALDDKQEGFIEAKELTGSAGQITVKPGSVLRARIAELGGRPGAVRLTPISMRDPDRGGESVAVVSASLQPGSGKIVVGAHVKGKVALVERFGVFLQLDGATPAQGAGASARRGVRGLIPTAELGLPRGADAHRHFPVGTEIEAKIVAIDERGRIRLSIAELAADEERKAYESFESQAKSPKGNADEPGRLATLGDLMAKFGTRAPTSGAKPATASGAKPATASGAKPATAAKKKG